MVDTPEAPDNGATGGWLTARLVIIEYSQPVESGSTVPPAKVSLNASGGPANGSCRYADARLNGDTVEIASDGGPVARVRYAWADYPIVNLYDQDLLPAPVFELPVQ